jgi:hypothetical protein
MRLKIEDSDSTPAIRTQIREATAANPAIAIVVTGDIGRRRGMLDGTTPAVVVVCAPVAELDADGVGDAEAVLPGPTPVVLNPTKAALDAVAAENHLGRATLQVGPDPEKDTQQMLLVALTKPGVQGCGLLVLTGDQASAETIAHNVRGWSLVAINPQ